MTKKRKSKSTAKPLGPMATRFAVHLDCGLHEFGECFEDYAPSFVSHEDYGKGLLFFQLEPRAEEEPDEEEGSEEEMHVPNYVLDTAVIATEDGIRFPGGSLICFNNEQPPEKVALLFLSAMVMETPCEGCQECENGVENFSHFIGD